jgi:hypothetical protein
MRVQRARRADHALAANLGLLDLSKLSTDCLAGEGAVEEGDGQTDSWISVRCATVRQGRIFKRGGGYEDSRHSVHQGDVLLVRMCRRA